MCARTNAQRDCTRGEGSAGNSTASWNTYFGPEQRYNFQLRAEAFSAFNHFNLGNPSTNITSGTVATITGGSGTRSIQLAAKILW